MSEMVRSARRNGEGGLGRFTQRVLVVAAIVVLALLVWKWRTVLLLAFFAALVASGLRGLAKPLYQRGAPESLAIGVAALLIVTVVAGVLMVFGAQIAGEFDTIARSLPGAWSEFRADLEQSQAGEFVLDQMSALAGPGGAVNELMRRVGPLAAATANAGLNVLLVVVAGIFFALSPRSYRDGVLLLAPRPMRAQLRDALDLSGLALRKWLGGTLVSMTAIALMVGTGLWLLGVPAPLGLALIAGLAQFVPLVGPTLASAPAILLAFSVGPLAPLWVALLYFGSSTIEANVLTPMIQRRAVSQSPVVTLFSVVAFGLLFGPLGVFLAVPIAVVATIFIVKFYVNDALGEQIAAPGERNGNGEPHRNGSAAREHNRDGARQAPR